MLRARYLGAQSAPASPTAPPSEAEAVRLGRGRGLGGGLRVALDVPAAGRGIVSPARSAGRMLPGPFEAHGALASATARPPPHERRIRSQARDVITLHEKLPNGRTPQEQW